MSVFDSNAFTKKVGSLDDDQLIALVTINSRGLIEDAVSIVKSEVEKRGLSADVQNLNFDIFLNASGFAGRFILLDEQLMFLSTGMAASGGGGEGSVVGIIASEAHIAARNVAAKNLDFSSLENEGSWIYYLDQIQKCVAKTSLLAGKQLLFEVKEEDGTTIDGIVQFGRISNEELESIAATILGAKAKFESK